METRHQMQKKTDSNEKYSNETQLQMENKLE